MNTEAILGILIEGDVLRETADGTELTLCDQFEAHVEAYEQQLTENSPEELTTDGSPGPKGVSEVPELLSGSAGSHHPLVAEWLALANAVDGLGHEDLISVLPYIDQLRRGKPSEEEVPQSFVPLQGDSIRLIVQMCERAIVYVYEPGSEESEIMRNAFDRLFEEPPQDLNLYAVHGPNWREELSKTFDVTYIPVTLFVLNGTVDVRLQGAQYDAAIENEIEKLKQATV